MRFRTSHSTAVNSSPCTHTALFLSLPQFNALQGNAILFQKAEEPLQLPALWETLDLHDDTECVTQCHMSFVCFNTAFVPCFDSVTLDPPSSFASCLALYTRSSTRTHICNPRDGRRPQDFVPELFRHPGGSGLGFSDRLLRRPPDSFQRPAINLKECFSVKGHNHEHTHSSLLSLSLPGTFLTAVPA